MVMLSTLWATLQRLHSRASPALLSHHSTVLLLVEACIYDDDA